MTDDEMVEVMARARHDATRGLDWKPWDDLVAAAADGNAFAETVVTVERAGIRAAIRACHEAGGLVLREVPGETIGPESVPWRYGDSWHEIQYSADNETLEAICNGYADGHNAALAVVRAAAVNVEVG